MTYLNLGYAYPNPNRLTLRIPDSCREVFIQRYGAAPADYFDGKTVRVYGSPELASDGSPTIHDICSPDCLIVVPSGIILGPVEPFVVDQAAIADPFEGTWSGIDRDPADGSVVTLVLEASGNQLTGSLSDAFGVTAEGHRIEPGYAGSGSGHVTSASSAEMTFFVRRSDGSSATFTAVLSLSDSTLEFYWSVWNGYVEPSPVLWVTLEKQDEAVAGTPSEAILGPVNSISGLALFPAQPQLASLLSRSGIEDLSDLLPAISSRMSLDALVAETGIGASFIVQEAHAHELLQVLAPYGFDEDYLALLKELDLATLRELAFARDREDELHEYLVGQATARSYEPPSEREVRDWVEIAAATDSVVEDAWFHALNEGYAPPEAYDPYGLLDAWENYDVSVGMPPSFDEGSIATALHLSPTSPTQDVKIDVTAPGLYCVIVDATRDGGVDTVSWEVIRGTLPSEPDEGPSSYGPVEERGYDEQRRAALLQALQHLQDTLNDTAYLSDLSYEPDIVPALNDALDAALASPGRSQILNPPDFPEPPASPETPAPPVEELPWQYATVISNGPELVFEGRAVEEVDPPSHKKYLLFYLMDPCFDPSATYWIRFQLQDSKTPDHFIDAGATPVSAGETLLGTVRAGWVPEIEAQFGEVVTLPYEDGYEEIPLRIVSFPPYQRQALDAFVEPTTLTVLMSHADDLLGLTGYGTASLSGGDVKQAVLDGSSNANGPVAEDLTWPESSGTHTLYHPVFADGERVPDAIYGVHDASALLAEGTGPKAVTRPVIDFLTGGGADNLVATYVVDDPSTGIYEIAVPLLAASEESLEISKCPIPCAAQLLLTGVVYRDEDLRNPYTKLGNEVQALVHEGSPPTEVYVVELESLRVDHQFEYCCPNWVQKTTGDCDDDDCGIGEFHIVTAASLSQQDASGEFSLDSKWLGQRQQYPYTCGSGITVSPGWMTPSLYCHQGVTYWESVAIRIPNRIGYSDTPVPLYPRMPIYAFTDEDVKKKHLGLAVTVTVTEDDSVSWGQANWKLLTDLAKLMYNAFTFMSGGWAESLVNGEWIDLSVSLGFLVGDVYDFASQDYRVGDTDDLVGTTFTYLPASSDFGLNGRGTGTATAGAAGENDLKLSVDKDGDMILSIVTEPFQKPDWTLGTTTRIRKTQAIESDVYLELLSFDVPTLDVPATVMGEACPVQVLLGAVAMNPFVDSCAECLDRDPWTFWSTPLSMEPIAGGGTRVVVGWKKPASACFHPLMQTQGPVSLYRPVAISETSNLGYTYYQAAVNVTGDTEAGIPVVEEAVSFTLYTEDVWRLGEKRKPWLASPSPHVELKSIPLAEPGLYEVEVTINGDKFASGQLRNIKLYGYVRIANPGDTDDGE